jgi:hypothetical protein
VVGSAFHKLLGFLFEPAVPLWRYCLAAVPIALLPSMLFLMVAISAVKGLNALGLSDIDLEALMPAAPPQRAIDHFLIIVATPAVETLLLALILLILGRVISSHRILAAVSALIWGALHGSLAPLWFVGTAWSFFVFSAGWLAWRGRSWGHAFLAASVPHAFINLLAMSAMSLAPAS